MNTAFVVEGTPIFHARTKHDRLNHLWTNEIPRAIGVPSPTRTLGINKGSIAAMRLRDIGLRRTTSITEPLDCVLERFRRTHEIDSFVVIWDLVPPWDKSRPACRWEETLAFYDGLANSKELDATFRAYCGQRLEELRNRPNPGQRTSPPRIAHGTVLPIIVEPLFESVFMDRESMKACLEVRGVKKLRWPKRWEAHDVEAPALIDAAVRSARKVSEANVFRAIRDDYEVAKTEWGIYFVASRHFDDVIRSHALGRRLNELLTKRDQRQRDTSRRGARS